MVKCDPQNPKWYKMRDFEGLIQHYNTQTQYDYSIHSGKTHIQDVLIV